MGKILALGQKQAESGPRRARYEITVIADRPVSWWNCPQNTPILQEPSLEKGYDEKPCVYYILGLWRVQKWWKRKM